MSDKLARVKPFFEKFGFWFVLGLVLAGLVIAGAVHWTTANYPPETLFTPQYTAQPPDPTEITFDLETTPAYTAEDGVVVIEPKSDNLNLVQTASFIDDPEKIWEEDEVVTYNSFTLPEKVAQEDGSLGVLTIPEIGLSVNVFACAHGEEMEAMTKGLAHFAHTTSWDGNLGVCGHNVNFDLTDGYFKNLHTLEKGDQVIYSSSLGERVYEVKTIKAIAEDDWSYLGRTQENKITMITCISGQPTKRLMVQAVETR